MVRQLLFIGAGIAVVFLYVRYIEQRSVYFPLREITQTPQDIGLSYQDIFVATSDGEKLNAWFIGHPGSSRVALFLHGNGGNISHRVEKIRLLHLLGLGVFIVDYRGYGRSSGQPSERGLYEDARAAYFYLTHTLGVKPPDVVLYGESLGSAVAVDLASRAPAGALILEGAFTSARGVAKRIYPFLPSFMLTSKFDSAAKIKSLSLPMFFIHSKGDEIVPYAMGRRLFEASPAPKEFLDIDGGHNEGFFFHAGKISAKLSSFLKEVLR